MTVEVRDPRFREVVGDDAPMERLGTGFAFTEGPVWHPVERHLIFSDMPGDHMRRWSEADGVTTFRQPARGHPGAGVRGQLHVGQRGLAEPFHHRLDFALPDPGTGTGPPRVLTRAPFGTKCSAAKAPKPEEVRPVSGAEWNLGVLEPRSPHGSRP